MKLYRYSPIENEQQLQEALSYVHYASHELLAKTFGSQLPNLGNIVLFCHYGSEYAYLHDVAQRLTDAEDTIDGKYFKLKKPLVLPPRDGIPETTFTYFYVRPPDPYRSQVGDVDFYLEPDKYSQLKQDIMSGKTNKGMRLFPRDDLDMVEVYNPDSDILGYIRAEKI